MFERKKLKFLSGNIRSECKFLDVLPNASVKQDVTFDSCFSYLIYFWRPSTEKSFNSYPVIVAIIYFWYELYLDKYISIISIIKAIMAESAELSLLINHSTFINSKRG